MRLTATASRSGDSFFFTASIKCVTKRQSWVETRTAWLIAPSVVVGSSLTHSSAGGALVVIGANNVLGLGTTTGVGMSIRCVVEYLLFSLLLGKKVIESGKRERERLSPPGSSPHIHPPVQRHMYLILRG